MEVAPTAPTEDSQNYTGKAAEYVTFFCYNEQGSAFAENEEIAVDSYFQIDLWKTQESTADSNTLKKKIITALKALGFMGFTAQELYERDTKINHIAVRCNYTGERL